MKKQYLMSGAMAVVLGALTVSCSNDIETFSLQDQKTAEYETVFTQTFGKISKTQDWGFGNNTRAITRAINVNGNMWDPEDVPVVTDAEVTAIYDYVKYKTDVMTTMGHKFDTRAPQNITDYYVTQVRNGLNDDNEYTFFDGQGDRTIKNVGTNMNHLQIAMNSNPNLNDLNGIDLDNNPNVSGWTHINNFNASDNKNYGGNTLVENGGTYDFAYHNSLDSKYHNKWILVDGADITSDGKYSNYLYVCFDFESTPECVTKFRFKYNGKEYGDIRVNGFYTVADAIAQEVKVTIQVPIYDENNNWLRDEDRTINLATDIDKEFSLRIDNIDNGDKHVLGDDIYTDWIVRITKGAPSETTTDPVVESGRIFCEDMGSIGDFDFNDVVFDAWIYQSGKIKITIHAAGGTLPLSVAGVQVNDVLGKMKNTGVGTAPTHTFTIPAEADNTPKYATLNDIPVVVSQTDPAGFDTQILLKAEIGKAPQKICVPVGTPWADEYLNIINAYPSFNAWVNGTATREDTFVTTEATKWARDLDLSNNGNATNE